MMIFRLSNVQIFVCKWFFSSERSFTVVKEGYTWNEMALFNLQLFGMESMFQEAIMARVTSWEFIIG